MKYLSLDIVSDSAETYFCKAVNAEAVGNRALAVSCYRQAVDIRPDWPEALFNLGNALLRLDCFQEAAAALERAVQHRPNWGPAWLNLGSAWSGAGFAEKAFGCWQKALHHDPYDAQAHYNCGLYYQTKGDLDPAVESYELALKHSPDMVQAHLNLGTCLEKLGRIEQAAERYQRAAVIEPTYALAWTNLAGVYSAQGRLAEAQSMYRKALALEPENHAIHLALSGVLRKQWRIEDAMAHCRKALAIAPHLPKIKIALFEMAQHGCHWQQAEELAPELDRITCEQIDNKMKPSEWPLLSLGRHSDPERNFAVARAWSRAAMEKSRNLSAGPVFVHRPAPHNGPIRIGYLSGDFKEHAIAHHIRGLLRLHDRSRFRIHGYAANPTDGSRYRDQLAWACDHFTPIDTLDDRRAAEKIQDDGIHILVDLSGHTQGNRMPVLALRPAPVQVGYLGFLGTSGAEFIDYFITDRVATPAHHVQYYSEKLVYLPHCYQVNDDTLAIGEQKYCREDMGLPEDGVAFCCFNQPYKINRPTFDAWLRILKQVPRSVLWLMDHNRSANQNMRRAASAAGIDDRRLVFSPPVRIDFHLARLQLADLALDTFPYNGGATTANALWAGVPLLALMGTHLVSRMSASALMAVGLPELVVSTPEDYCAKAVELALDKTVREAVRSRLAVNRTRAPLFDTRLFTRHLEAAYEIMVARFNSGRAPASFAVECQNGDLSVKTTSLSSDPGTLARSAQTHVENGRLAAAADLYLQMLAQCPDHADLHHLLGLVYLEMEQWEKARHHIQRAIDCDPGKASYLRSLGDALQGGGNLVAAHQAYQQALTLQPDDAAALINLGNVFYGLAQTDQAQRCYERALQTEPQSVVALNNMGKSCYDRREVSQALQWYEHALAIDPSYAEARFNRAVALLLTGDYRQGWQEYEWRFRRRGAGQVYPHPLKGPRWQGETYSGRRLLVHCEQGMGDVLQFARYLPQVKALGGTLLLEVHEPLLPLLRNLPGVDELVVFSPRRPPTIAYDLHISLLSLPRLFGTTIETIPADFPYLRSDNAKTGQWHCKIAADGLRVGLVWSCSNTASYRESRLEYFQPLLELAEVHWYSLQKGAGTVQIAALPRNLALTHLGDDLNDFSDTAAVIANLDLLISVDTAVIHVAGAMGVPVWVLLPFAGDWRWLLDRSDSPWYPSVRLFRQSRPGDWPGVVHQVRGALEELIRQGKMPGLKNEKAAYAENHLSNQ
jgi:protein O-GlcNAc transferase